MTQQNRMSGAATGKGTGRYRDRFAAMAVKGHFRQSNGLWLSSIGIGTYLGEPNEADDAAYRESVGMAVRSGCNVIDTAVNYRYQRSERSVGKALADLFAESFAREEIVVATKGGFIPFDGTPDDPSGWFRTALLEPGIATPDDVVANCHIMTPHYLKSQIEWSLENLGLETIDIYYLHNPETQLGSVERPEFLMRVKAAFEMLEKEVEASRIGIYGVATWDGLRVGPDHPGHLSLRELVTVARQAGGEAHHFRAIQLPVNLAMPEACLHPSQSVDGGRKSLLEAASDYGMTVMASGSLLQGKIIGSLGPEFEKHIEGAETNAQRGLQVVRSVPGLATALVGMRRVGHVEENLSLARKPVMPAERAIGLLRACNAG